MFLFLREPNSKEDGDSESTKHIISLLSKLESVIGSVVTSEGRSEARLWLCDTISGTTFVTAKQQRDLFMDLLRSKPTKRSFASKLMQMILDKRPQKLGRILAKRSFILEKFFQGNPTRILRWFSAFADNGGSDHKKGAKALSQFAFTNRDICWEELEWRGKHGQSPAVVASKPHYFLDLDVQRTVENFLEYVPEFWSSDEFAESLKDGEILLLDTHFFLDFFVDLMDKEDSRDIWEVINDFLTEESFSSLAHCLLITLEERDFCTFLELLRCYVKSEMNVHGFVNQSYWFEIILSNCTGTESFDQILLLNSVINQGRRLLRFVCDEDTNVKKQNVTYLILNICRMLGNLKSLSSVLNECCKKKTVEAIKLLGVLSWVIHYKLSKESPESWESLFIDNGIKFREYDKYTLIPNDGFSDESEPVVEARHSKSKHGKKSKRKRKRRKNSDDYFGHDNELLDFDTSDRLIGLNRAGGWLLSTDGFSTSWTIVDLPEHLSRHCFSTWMKWLVAG